MQVPEVGDDMSDFEANARPIGNQDMNEASYIIYSSTHTYVLTFFNAFTGLT